MGASTSWNSQGLYRDCFTLFFIQASQIFREYGFADALKWRVVVMRTFFFKFSVIDREIDLFSFHRLSDWIHTDSWKCRIRKRSTVTRRCWSPCHQYVSRGGDWSVTVTRRHVQSPLKALAPACIMADTSMSLSLPFYIQVPVEMESALGNWTDFNRNCHCGKYTPSYTANL